MIISIITTFILSSLISDKVNDVNRSVARQSFQEKYYNLEYEFGLLQRPLVQAEKIIAEEAEFELAYQKLILMQKSQFLDSMIQNSWLFIEENGEVRALNENNRTPNGKVDSLFVKQENSNAIIQHGEGEYLWRNQIAIPTKQGTVYFGYDFNLIRLQSHFWDFDSYSQSYAYVFSENGTCILHPDTANIGKNAFEFASYSQPIREANTNSNYFNEKIVNSEFLQLEVVSYLKELKIGNNTWFVSVNFPNSIHEEDINVIKTYTFSIYFIYTALLLFIFYFFSRRLNRGYRERAKLEQEKAKLAIENEVFQKKSAFFQLQQLKKQINPHLFFNSLNTLYTLIDQDKELTKQFTHKLSKLYRYLTDKPEDNISAVRDEITIVEEFLFMQKIRFGERMVSEIQLDQSEEILKRKVPYLAVQMAVENAIKHNIATVNQPLSITVKIVGDNLTVKNNYAPKKVSEEQKGAFGLRYLRSIYEFYKKEGFNAYIEDGHFICELPLL